MTDPEKMSIEELIGKIKDLNRIKRQNEEKVPEELLKTKYAKAYKDLCDKIELLKGALLNRYMAAYPDPRSLYEQYNGIREEDEPDWKALTEQAEAMIGEAGCTKLKEQAILYTVAELERIAKRRAT